MQFKYYDTLSTLINGTVLLFVLSLALNYSVQDVNVIFLLAIAYVLGYILNALSAFLEPVYFWFMGGKPSIKLLTYPKNNKKDEVCKYTGPRRIRFYEYDKAISLLKEELNDDKPEPWEMFEKAKSYSNANDKTRVPDFNTQYAFSRVILTLSIVSSVVLMPQYYNHWYAWLIVTVAIFFVGRRCKERGYYYAREVLIEYIKNKELKS